MPIMSKSAVCLLVALALLFAAMTVAAASPQRKASWTMMVYLDADNNLDPDAYVDVAEMEVVGSTATANVVVLWDKLDGPAYLYQVLPGRIEMVKGFSLNGQEVDMGDGRTLATLVDFVTAKFPASHYLLDLWDHGDDFRGFAWDDHPYADGSPGRDFMTHDEIVAALTGHHLDILAFDGCVMSNLEVSYEYAARGLSIDYIVASETYIPNQGFAYDGLLQALVDHPGLGPLGFAKAIVDSYLAYYSGGGWQVGLSVIRIAAVPSLVTSIGALADTLMADMAAYRDCVGTGRGEAMLGWSLYGWDALVDFPTFVAGLRGCLGSNAVLDPLFDAVTAGLGQTVLYVGNTHALDVKGAGGIGVFFPGSAGSFENNIYWHSEYFLKTLFASQVWYDFLCCYWGMT
ncbi:MAG: clostripain-related cysteine peptidase [Thermoplasmata archaeon]